MDRTGNLRRRTDALLEQGSGDTERLATEWAMPFIPEDSSTSPTDIPFTTARRPQRQASGCVTFFGRIMMLFGILVLLSGIYGGFSLMSRTAHRTTLPIVKAVSGVPTVHIENSIGRVQVFTGTSDKVEVVAEVEVRHISQGLAEQAVENYDLEVTEPTPGNIAIVASERNPFDGDDPFAGWLAHRSVNLTVTVPTNTNLDFDVSAGKMTVQNVVGRVNAVVNAGSLDLIDVQLADGSSFNVKAGSVYFDGELQPDASLDVQVSAGSAELLLPKSTNARLEGHANAGSIRAGGWVGVDLPRIQGDDSMSISGNLTNTTIPTKSLISVNVNAGSAEINARADRTFDPDRPAFPSVPSIPSAPPVRQSGR